MSNPKIVSEQARHHEKLHALREQISYEAKDAIEYLLSLQSEAMLGVEDEDLKRHKRDVVMHVDEIFRLGVALRKELIKTQDRIEKLKEVSE